MPDRDHFSPMGEPPTEPAPISFRWTLEQAVDRAADAFPPLADATRRLVESAPEDALATACGRGFFRPVEEELLVAWFARFLSVRDGLWEILGELIGALGGELSGFEARLAEDDDAWAAFGLGYGAACAVVHLDRFLVEIFGIHPIARRKLDEGFPEHRISRKRFTAVFESLTDPASALFFDEAIELRKRLARRLHHDLERPGDERLVPVAERLAWLESSLDRSKRRFLRLFGRFQHHALRRRLATIREHGVFSLLEGSGRVVSEIRDRWHAKLIDDDVRRQIAALLRPGDVFATRHERAMTNLFLPGYWPHAALHVGTEDDRQRLGVEVDAERCRLWSGPCRVLEALKDGVRFRPLVETLAVDAVAVIRPRLPESIVAEALARAARHEGKGYNFDFDFFRSDRLVCTEVVYRAFDGLGGLEIPLRERAGRPTLSAEDLLNLALDSDAFEVVAVYGVPQSPRRLFTGHEAVEPLRRSYRGEA